MLRLSAVFILVALFSLRVVCGADAEEDAFRSANAAFSDKFYERAEEQFSLFATNFPASTNLAKAVLLQAQSRHFQKKHDAAIELLKTSIAKAGALADQYVLTWGEALSAKGDHAGAAEQYGRLLKDFGTSPLRLQAAYLQALSFFQQKDFPRTIDLLATPESEFKKLADAAPQNHFTFAGKLLLTDALLAAERTSEAREAAAALPLVAERPEWQWERFDALARVELAGTNIQAAIPHLTNAVAAAQAAQRPRLQAQSWNLEAELYRKLGQPLTAVSSYEKIAAVEALPIDERRLAVLKAVELLSSSGQLTNAIRRLEIYLGSATNEPAADLLKVKAGELWIDHARARARAAKPAGSALANFTNALTQARAHLNSVLTQHTNSTYLGRAWLNLGWSFWEEGLLMEQPSRLQESEAAFRTASEKLTRSDDQALAIFKLGDTQIALGQTKPAITNYVRLLKDYADLPQVKNALFARTYAQLIRANIEIGEMAAAESFLKELREAFPNNPATEEALFSFAQALMTGGKVRKARALFQDFLNQYPTSPFSPEVRFAEARTYSVEGDFGAAVQKHEQWLRSFTNHALRADVQFQRGVLLEKAGQTTNAFTVFTNFVGEFATSALAPAAQMWIADHYFNQELWPRAEQNYQRVFQNTNWGGVPLAYYARLMAARTAFKRGGYNDARSYLTNLVNDPNCPSELKPKAWFALGDIFLEEPISGSTNALYNFTQAAAVFERVATQYPTNAIALLALAKKGDCYFQLGSHPNYSDSYLVASNAYSTVLNARSELPMKVRNQAEFGLARVLERMAEGKPVPEKLLLRKAALKHFLNIVYGDETPGQKADPFYLKLAGREAGRLAEELGDSDAALELYKRLSSEAPASKGLWESRITQLQNGRAEKAQR